MTLEEDFAELLDATLEEDFTELLLDRSSTGAEDDERTLLLDRSSTGAEDDERTELLEATLDDERTELLDTLASLSLDCGVTFSLLDDMGSSSRGAKLLSSSPQAAKRASAKPSKNRFIQKFLLFHHF